MFIKTYEKLREYIINNKSITTLVQMEYSAFEEATVPICSFVLKNGNDEQRGMYIKLSDFKGGMDVQKQKVLEGLADTNCDYFYETTAENFSKIPGMPIAYWVSNKLLKSFSEDTIKDYGFAGIGMRTGDNERFLRRWFEVIFSKFDTNSHSAIEQIENCKKWIPYNKGGEFKKWYGNNEYVVNWENNGYEIKENTKLVYPQLGDNLGWKISNENYYFKPGITWSGVTSGDFSCRCYEYGYIFDSGANGLFAFDEQNRYYLAGWLNTKLANYILKIINPTINTGSGTLNSVPVKMVDEIKEDICSLVKSNILISKNDWDSFENSWDFTKHPFLKLQEFSRVSEAYDNWQQYTDEQFSTLKNNEELINRMFNDVFKMAEEMSYEVDDKKITIRRADIERDIRSFISYAVGCMFGRYSLDEDGLIYAGGQWDDNKYTTFIPDKDNCILITDEEYLEDDIVGLFVAFVKKVYGIETLEENLDFIAKALGNKGDNSREVIRNYFLKDFFKDHIKIYQKRPIYWLYDSGKQDGFKALIYMHRYNADTTGIVRVDYLHKMQKIYMNEIDRMQDMIENSTRAREIAQAEKRKEKLIKQLKETKEYDEKIAHIALSRIDIDLDDGVKVNYEKVQTGHDGKRLNILAKI
jgi:type II restriction/modification system DNA methylase subunit YeeA